MRFPVTSLQPIEGSVSSSAQCIADIPRTGAINDDQRRNVRAERNSESQGRIRGPNGSLPRVQARVHVSRSDYSGTSTRARRKFHRHCLQTEPKKDATADDTESARPVWKNPIVAVGRWFRRSSQPSTSAISLGRVPQHTRDEKTEINRQSIIQTEPIRSKARRRPKGTGGGVVSSGATTPTRNPKIPVELSYPVMDEQRDPPISRTIKIAINMKVSKEILAESP